MKKIITINDIQPFLNYDKYISAIMRYNNISEMSLGRTFPDLGLFNINFDYYFSHMEKVDGTDEFIRFVMENKDKPSIVISDHDCDGIMACVILTMALATNGINISYMATDRFTSGYGMKKKNIDMALKTGAEVLYTVDQGITCYDAIQHAKNNGMKICITDHHNGPIHVDADCVIDPDYVENKTSFKAISGATVALKLGYELTKAMGGDLRIFEDLGALAGITVLSDVMPIIGENRLLYKAMVNHCNKNANKNTFIRRLVDLINFYVPGDYDFISMPPSRDFNKTNLDFYFVPIINAVNRVEGNVDDLITDIIQIFYRDYDGDPKYYYNINNTRKQMKKDLLGYHHKTKHSVVVDALKVDSDINYGGIAGLIASDIVGDEKKPCLLGIDQGQDRLSFSGRSLPGYDLYSLLDRVKNTHPELDLQFGGHAEALGASIPRNNILPLQEALSEEFDKDKYEVEEEYFLLDNTDAWIRVFQQFSPFGNRFQMPQFYVKTTINYCNVNTRQFSLKGCGRTGVKCYGRNDLNYIFYLATRARDTEIEAIVELVYDEVGNIGFKLVDILNKDKDIVREINSEREKFYR